MIEHLRFYLSGPIDRVADRGIGWRQDFTHRLLQAGVERCNVLDPTDNPTKSKDLDKEFKEFEDAKKNRNLPRVRALAKKMMREDLRMVDVADCLILGVFGEDGKFPMLCGTLHEVIVATTQHKPVYIVTNLDWIKFPNWLIGLLPEENYFWDMDECIKAILRDIESNSDHKWVFLENLYERKD